MPPERIYGRSREIAQLRSWIDVTLDEESGGDCSAKRNISKSATSLILLAGPRGVGKRTLVETAQRPRRSIDTENTPGTCTNRRNCLFLSGRFSPTTSRNGTTGSTQPHKSRHEERVVTASVPAFPVFDEALQGIELALDEEVVAQIKNAFIEDALLSGVLEHLMETFPAIDRLFRSDSSETVQFVREERNASVNVLPPHLNPNWTVNLTKWTIFCLNHFFRIVSSYVPVVLFLDHIHYSDTHSLQLCGMLLKDEDHANKLISNKKRSTTHRLLLVATYRSDLEFSDHFELFVHSISAQSNRNRIRTESPLPGTPAKLTKDLYLEKELQIYALNVASLDWNACYSWIVDTCNGCWSEDIIHETTDLVFELSAGNPLYVTSLLHYLKQFTGLFDQVTEGEILFLRASLPRDTDTLLQQLVLKQSPLFIKMVNIVSAWEECNTGCCRIDLDTSMLEMVLKQPCSEELLQAQKLELMRTKEEKVYFIRPDIQQMVYQLIPETQLEPLHLKIGRTIWNRRTWEKDNADTPDIGAERCMVACQLRRGARLITDYEERHAIATLTFRVAQFLMKASSFAEASKFVDFGIAILRDDVWSTEKYEISLALHNCAAEAYYCCGRLDDMDRVLDVILTHATTFRDKLHAYNTLVYTRGARHRLTEAIPIALDVLKQLGQPIASNPETVRCDGVLCQNKVDAA